MNPAARRKTASSFSFRSAAGVAAAWLAAPSFLRAAAIDSPIRAKEFQTIIVSIADWAAAIAAPLATLMVIYAAYLYLLSGGSEESTTRAHKAITWAVVGLIVVLVSKSLALLLQNVLGAK